MPETARGRESLDSLRAERDRLADFIRLLAADNPRTMALDARTQAKAHALLDSIPPPPRCPAAEPDAPAGGHAYFLPTDAGMRCLYCRTLRPDTHHQEEPAPSPSR